MMSSAISSTAFTEYDEATQRHIIELGCFIYDKSLEHYREIDAASAAETTTTSSTVSWSKEYEYNQLKQQVENLSKRVFETREEEYKKGETKVAEYNRGETTTPCRISRDYAC